MSEQHHDNVKRLASFLRQDGRYFVLTEVGLSRGERVDIYAIDLKTGDSITMDWKESVEDAKAHFRKPHVIDNTKGIGLHRYLVCEPHVLTVEAIPPDVWVGLFWFDGVGLLKHATSVLFHSKASVQRERLIFAREMMRLMKTGQNQDDRRASKSGKLTPDEVNQLTEWLQTAQPGDFVKACGLKGKKIMHACDWIEEHKGKTSGAPAVVDVMPEVKA